MPAGSPAAPDQRTARMHRCRGDRTGSRTAVGRPPRRTPTAPPTTRAGADPGSSSAAAPDRVETGGDPLSLEAGGRGRPVWGRKQGCAVQKVLIFSKCKSCPASGSLQPVAIEATRGGNETVGAFETDGSHGDSASRQAVTASERSSGLEKSNVVADPALVWGRPPPLGTGKRLE